MQLLIVPFHIDNCFCKSVLVWVRSKKIKQITLILIAYAVQILIKLIFLIKSCGLIIFCCDLYVLIILHKIKCIAIDF